MIYLILGLILLASPFLILGIFKDKKIGFIYVLFFWVLFQALLAIITQLFGIFSFWPVFLINAIAVISAVIFMFLKKDKFSIKKIDWMLVFIVLVSIISLCQVHYNFTGKINFATDQTVAYHDVKNMVYPYPYFSDEWGAVSLMKHSIRSGSLPVINPLDNSPYQNFAIPFFSFLSGLALILKVDPLTSFNFFTIFIAALIIVLSYIFLRINKIPETIAGISALFLLYIPSTASLPGLWQLIPIHTGIMFSLIGFCFMSLGKTRMAVFSAFMVLAFYPPLILFYGLALLIFLFFKIDIKDAKQRRSFFYAVAGLFLVLITAGILYILAISSPILSKTLDFMISRLIFPSFSGDFIPQYDFYNIIPVVCLLFFAIGIIHLFKNFKWLLSQVVLGASFWALYSFWTYRIIIDYERISLFTSVIVILASAFGFKIACDYIDSRLRIMKYPASILLKAGFIVFFVAFMPSYTSQNNWQKFFLLNPDSGQKVYPKSVANNYLVEDDLKIFKGIAQKNFLSVPWKGLVIGTATNNYPAVTKEAIISVGSYQTVNQFLMSDCGGKSNMAKNLKLDYIYLYKLDCEGFEKIGQSSEGFILYKINK